MDANMRYCAGLVRVGVSPALELFLNALANDQTMFGFILLGAWQDSARRRISLGAQDAVLLYAYVLACLFLGPFFSALAPNTFADAPAYHAWYLLMVLWARFSMRILQAISVPSSLQVLLHFALAMFGPIMALHIPGDWGLKLAPYDGYLYHSWFQCYTVIYTAAFYSVRPSVGFFKPKIASLRLGPIHALASFCLSVAIGAVWILVHYPSLNFNFDDYVRDHPSTRFWLLPETLVPCLICALQVFSMVWCPVPCRWSGGSTLGTYLTHFYLLNPDLWNRFSVFISQLSSLNQALILAMCPLIFTIVVGPCLHQICIVAPQSLARVLGSVCAALQWRLFPQRQPSC
eukprot:TRINITY_DN13117_c0_g1_i1.p1 TRINITY_DN13117_c0_g1~~TRINITY_DN13117_c0_g1_i1.p1  ORF type:complete len:399 (-),score=2.98 TRINITY_DN13117_c0_g1_i1:261-1298(-)